MENLATISVPIIVSVVYALISVITKAVNTEPLQLGVSVTLYCSSSLTCKERNKMLYLELVANSTQCLQCLDKVLCRIN